MAIASPKYEHVDDGRSKYPVPLPGPRRLSRYYNDVSRLAQVFLDIIGISSILLVVIFGSLVYQADGNPAASRGSQQLLSVALFVSIIRGPLSS